MEFKFNGRDNDKIIGDIFESFIAACYIDKGFDITKKYFYNILNNEIDFSNLIKSNNTNYKGIISIHYQKISNTFFQKYIIKNETGPSHKKIYTIDLLDNNGVLIGSGVDTTKKELKC